MYTVITVNCFFVLDEFLHRRSTSIDGALPHDSQDCLVLDNVPYKEDKLPIPNG
jgi:hypothetical protein